MDIRVLGPVEVSAEGRPVAIRAGKPRALLALLALHEGSTVSTDRLVEELWGDEPPPTAAKMVQLCVSQLRKVIPTDDGGAEIVTRGHGYELRLGDGQLDASRFEHLIAAGRPREALGLWRGTPLADLAHEPFAAIESRRLEDLRLTALELAIDRDLAAGRHFDVVGELDALVTEQPLRERFHAQRMLALYRCGRQAEALEAYRRARAALVEAIGIEPGPELRRLHEAILAQDPALEVPTADQLRRRVDATAAGRASLRAAEDELAGDIVALQVARRQAEPSRDGVVLCPFKGLASFEVDDAAFFCGRERLVAELVARLAGAPLLGIVGPSGSGKSSALKAGLLPALADGVLPGSEHWVIAQLRPGEQPLRALDEARDAAAARQGRLVLAIDQFEELFTVCRDAEQRAAFADALVAAVRGPARRALVLIGLRADFYGRCAVYPELWRLLGANQVPVGPMAGEELRRAIELPTYRAGLEIEPALTDALVADLEGEPGALPLLSTSLLELWQHRDGRRLHLAAYARSGGVHGAVARLAESAYERLSAPQRETARAILLRLAGEGEGDAAVRARVPLDEFGEDVQPVLEELADSRLLAVSKGEVEVAHEALLREWPRLRGWLEEDAEGRRLHRHLRAAARDWNARGRDASELYRGSRLAAALDWAREHGRELSAAERAFLEAGRAASERTHRRLRLGLIVAGCLLVVVTTAGLIALDERGNARDQATAADAQRLGARALLDQRLDRSLLLARQGVALDDSVLTRGNLLAALTRSPAAIGVIRWDQAPMLSDAVSPDGAVLAVSNLAGQVGIFDTATRRRVTTIEPAANAPGIVDVAFSPDGERLAALYTSVPGSTQENPPGWRFLVAIVDATTFRVQRRIALPREQPAAGIRFSPDARTLGVELYSGTGGALERFDPRTGRRSGAPVPFQGSGTLTRGPYQRWPRTPVMTASDGRLVVGGTDAVTERDPTTLAVLKRFPRAGADAIGTTPTAYALSGDGRTVAIGGEDGSMRFLELDSGDVRTASGHHSGAVNDASFTPDGRTLVTVGQDGDVILWDVRKAVSAETLTGHERSAFSPQLADRGATLYTASLDGTVMIWDLSSRRRLGTRFATGAGDDDNSRYALSSDGRLLAHGQTDGDVVVTDMRTLTPRAPIRVVHGTGIDGPSIVEGMAFVPRSHVLVVGGTYGSVALVDVDHSRVVRRLTGHPTAFDLGGKRLANPIWTPGVSADGRKLVTGSSDGTVKLWSLPDARPIRTLRLLNGGGGVSDTQLSPDGHWLSIQALTPDIAQDRLEIWDARPSARRSRPAVTLRPPGGVNFGRFSPDGRFLALGDLLGRAIVYSTATWKPVTPPLGAGEDNAASFAPDGSMLATDTGTGAVQLWDIPSGQPIGSPLPGLPDVGVIPFFTPDGGHLIAGYQFSRAYVWDIRPASLIRHACEVAGRRLTRGEWNASLPGRAYRPAC